MIKFLDDLTGFTLYMARIFGAILAVAVLTSAPESMQLLWAWVVLGALIVRLFAALMLWGIHKAATR